MARKPKIDLKLITAAEKAVKETRNLHDMKQAQAILLPGQFGLSLMQTAHALGTSRASVHRWQKEFRLKQAGNQLPRISWGGRRRENLTFEEEVELLRPFIKTARAGGVLTVNPIKSAYEERLERAVADSTIYRLLARHNWRKLMPRPRHPKADEAAQTEWKKNCLSVCKALKSSRPRAGAIYACSLRTKHALVCSRSAPLLGTRRRASSG